MYYTSVRILILYSLSCKTQLSYFFVYAELCEDQKPVLQFLPQKPSSLTQVVDISDSDDDEQQPPLPSPNAGISGLYSYSLNINIVVGLLLMCQN